MSDGSHKIDDGHWLNVTKEFYRWKKTPEYERWRRKQFLRQGGLCWYCQIFLPVTRQHVEHKTARSLGGDNNLNNLVIACANCNKTKGSSPLSPEVRRRCNAQNKRLRGTYRRNKEHFDNLYGWTTDLAFAEMVSRFRSESLAA